MANEKQDELDRVLDAALAKYAAAEPRAGLEERVLANLRAERAPVPDRAWWRWSVIAALAAVFLVALALRRSGRPSDPVVANQPAGVGGTAESPATQVVSKDEGNQAYPQERKTIRRTGARRPRSGAVMVGNPKLDQFPSPQPLSEQEKILRSYVAENPEQAVLLARAQTEELRQDQLEEMKAFPSGDPATDSEERNNGTTER